MTVCGGLENLRAVVWVLDREHTCRWVSQSVRSVLGREPGDLVGTKPVILAGQDEQRFWRDYQSATVSNEPTFTARYQAMTGGGSTLWVDITVDSQVDDAGERDARVVTLVDVTSQQDAEQRLAGMLGSALEPHVYLRAVRDDSSVIVDFRIEDANEAACVYLGAERSDLEGTLLTGILSTTDAQDMFTRYALAVESGEPLELAGRPFSRLSGVREVLVDIRARKAGDGLSLDWRDVTERVAAAQALASSEQHFRELAESIGDVVRVFDLEGNHEWVSPSVQDLLGYTPQDLIGTSAVALMHPDDVATVFSVVTRSIEDQTAVTAPRRTRLRHADGHWVWTETTNSFQYGADGSVTRVYAVSRDAELQVRAEMELKRLAETDPLTGLLNRACVFDRLAEIVQQKAENVAVLFCDIDGLKQINDSRGHAAGDAVIASCARRCVELLDSQALVARFGGDELLIVLSGVADLAAATETANRLREATDGGASGEGEVGTSMSIGVTMLHPGETLDVVVARADRAMYDAKAAGRNRVVSVA